MVTREEEHAIFIKLLREHGIDISPLEEVKARTLAVARGELKLPSDEPELGFVSIEVFIQWVKTKAAEMTIPPALSDALIAICVKCRSNEWGPNTPRKVILNWMHDTASKALALRDGKEGT